MDDKRGSDSDSHRNRKKELCSDLIKGAGPGRRVGTGGRYEIVTDPSGRAPRSSAMIMDMSKGRVKQGFPVGEPVLRFDRPHPGANYPHININSKISGRPDPHIRVPSSVVKAAPKAGKFLKCANKVVVPAAVVMDGHRILSAYRADKESGDQDYTKTKTEAAGVAGSWGGAAAGGIAGARLGTMVFPGIGTITGGLIGGVLGGFAGDSAGRAVAERTGRQGGEQTGRQGGERTGEKRNCRCKRCGKPFMCAPGKDKLYCENCK